MVDRDGAALMDAAAGPEGAPAILYAVSLPDEVDASDVTARVIAVEGGFEATGIGLSALRQT